MSERKNLAAKVALAALLALCILFSCVSPAFAASNTSPVIHVYGRNPIYDKVSTANPEKLLYTEDDVIDGVVMDAVPYAATALITGDWDTYSDRTYALFMEAYKGFPLNEDGEVFNDTGILNDWRKKPISTNVTGGIHTYGYYYDCRLSPLELADDLNDYIEAVKKTTGKKKVSIVGRCLGANVMLAYLYKYQEKKNFSGIESIVFYDSSVYGVDALDAAMSGCVTFDTDALSRFLREYDPSVESESVASVLAASLDVMQSALGIRASASAAQRFYDNVKYSLFQRLMKSTYATAPGCWSMVYDHYEEAKQYIFNEPGDALKYSRLIAKIDDYHKNVQLRAEEIIKKMRLAGVNVAAVCKYGFSGAPVSSDAYMLSDNTTSLFHQSFGATCSKVDSTLPSSYIAAREKEGFGKMISPDRQVDAYTGLLASNTWYVKNLPHEMFPPCVDPLLLAICRERISVNSKAIYPRFMVFTNGKTQSVAPMTAQNCDPNGDITYESDVNGSALYRIFSVFRYLFSVLRRLFGALTGAGA